MNYLAIDTASSSLKILLSIDGERKYYQSEDFRATSETLLPEIDKLLGGRVSLGRLDTLACVIGPGSFTGIRIGLAAVKALAYALDKPVIKVNTLQLLAYNYSGAYETVVAVCDAGNGQRYLAVYDDKMNTVLEPKCLSAEELTAFIGMIEEPYELFCDGVSQTGLSAGHTPDASSLKNAFARAVESQTPESYNAIEPAYIRKPQAERDLENK